MSNTANVNGEPNLLDIVVAHGEVGEAELAVWVRANSAPLT